MQSYTYCEEQYSDLYKEANGFRPKSSNLFYSSSPDEKQKIWDSLLAVAKKESLIEATERLQVAEYFEHTIKLMESMGYSRLDAIKRIAESNTEEAYNEFPDYGYICYEIGLPYSYEKEFKLAFEYSYEKEFKLAYEGEE